MHEYYLLFIVAYVSSQRNQVVITILHTYMIDSVQITLVFGQNARAGHVTRACSYHQRRHSFLWMKTQEQCSDNNQHVIHIKIHRLLIQRKESHKTVIFHCRVHVGAMNLLTDRLGSKNGYKIECMTVVEIMNITCIMPASCPHLVLHCCWAIYNSQLQWYIIFNYSLQNNANYTEDIINYGTQSTGQSIVWLTEFWMFWSELQASSEETSLWCPLPAAKWRAVEPSYTTRNEQQQTFIS